MLVLGVGFVFGFPLGMMIWQGLFPSGDRWVYLLAQRFSTLKCTQRRKEKDTTLPSRGRHCAPTTFVSNQHGGNRASWSGVSLLFLLEGELRVWYWDVLLFYRRALFQLVFVFAPVGVTQQSLFAVLQLLFLILHVHHRPYSSRLANYTETMSYAILLVVNFLNFPSSIFTSVTLQQTSHSRDFLQALSRVQSVLSFAGLLLLAVVIAGVYGMEAWRVVASHTKRRKEHARDCKILCYFRKNKRSKQSQFALTSLEMGAEEAELAVIGGAKKKALAEDR